MPKLRSEMFLCYKISFRRFVFVFKNSCSFRCGVMIVALLHSVKAVGVIKGLGILKISWDNKKEIR